MPLRCCTYFLLAMLCVLGACGRTSTGIDVGTTSAFAAGTVLSSGGTPVAGAAVQLFSYRTCNDSLPIGSGAFSVFLTDVAGHYVGRVISPTQPAMQCIEARVNRSTTNTAASVKVRSNLVAFRVFDGTVPQDTARINVVLP
jgi:hypothetical protein